MRRGSAMFSGLMIRRSGASRISIGNRPYSHIAKIGPPGWHGTICRDSVMRRDSASPSGVNGGAAGHRVFDHGGGPAGFSKVPTATQTPVNPSCAALDGAGVAAGVELHAEAVTARAAPIT